MFIELDQLLLQSRHFAREYWEDCALLEAEDYLHLFEAADWASMEQSLPLRPFYWRLNCIDVLKQHPIPQSVTLLGSLCYDSEKNISKEARRTVSKLAKRSKPGDAGFEQLEKLNREISAGKKKFGFFPLFE